MPSYARSSPVMALVSDVVISVIAVALVGGAFLRLRPELREKSAWTFWA
ncbi:hypothetical protein AB0L22_27540 [Micromonospora haikouensis]